MIQRRKILITGTHLTPAIELIRQLHADKDIDWDIYYIGRRHNSSVSKIASIESEIIPRNQTKFFGISCGKLDRRWLPNTLHGLPQIIKGFFEAYQILKKTKPKIVVSFGGYVSVPTIIAASFQKIPSITHEQTQTLSLSTKINSLFCQKVALSFPHKNLPDKYIFTGNLLRQNIFEKSSPFFEKEKLNLKKYPLLYITAGNQGSHHLNIIIEKLLPVLAPKYTIIHQCGLQDFDNLKKYSSKYPHYFVKNYIDSLDIGWIFHHSQIIISRSGANTTQEIAALNKNSIQIPLPLSQQDEQLKNALWLSKKYPKNTIIINDAQLSTNLLHDSIDKLAKIKPQSTLIIPSPNLNLLKLIKRL